MKKALDLDKKKLLWIAIAVVVIALWISFGRLEVIASAEGRVIPYDQVKILQNLEGGIVTEINAKPGQKVKRGDVLFKLSDLSYRNELTSLQRQVDHMRIRLARLESEVVGSPVRLDPRISAAYPDILRYELKELEVRQAKRTELEKNISLSREERNITASLTSRGLESRSELLRVERSLSDRAQALRDLTESTLTDYNKTQAEIGAREESLLTLRDKLERTDVIAPVDGIVGNVTINTLGGVAKPGEPLATLVPLESDLIVEAKLKPADVAFVRPGTKARIQITAYDASVFGRIEAEVLTVAPDATQTEKGEQFYLVRLKTLSKLKGPAGSPLEILPGMMANVSIITQERTFLQYLFKPIQILYQQSFKEQ